MPTSAHTTTLTNGIRIVSECYPHFRSEAIGLLVGTGSRDEPAELAGAFHYYEHLAFKGAGDRDADAVAQAIDRLGGGVDAFTSKETVAFQGRVLAERARELLELLADMVRRPWLRPEDLDRERLVILEEIAMYEDAPEEMAHALLEQLLWPGHPLGREIVGDRATVGRLQVRDLVALYEAGIAPDRLLVAAAGPLPHERLVAWAQELLGDWSAASSLAPRRPPVLHAANVWRPRKELEQLHLIFGGAGLTSDDPDRFAEELFLNWLGGGASSLLFQEVRERRGLAYSIYTFGSGYQDAGSFGVYLATSPARAEEALHVTQHILEEATATPPSEETCRLLKQQFVSSYWLGLETSMSHMQRLAQDMASLGEVMAPDEVVRRVEAVTPADVQRVAERLVRAPLSLVAVGNLPNALKRGCEWRALA